MNRPGRICNFFCAWGLTLALASGCDAPGGPGAFPSVMTPDGGSPDATPVLSAVCTPARASEDLRGRISLNGIAAMPSGMGGVKVVQTSELFQRFNTVCGGCHVSTTNGGMHTTAATFATDIDQIWLGAIESDDPATAMPPEGKVLSSRADNDPVVQLDTYLTAWLLQGRPSDAFAIDDASGDATSATSYMYSTMTNLGTCIPGGGMYASSPSDEMESKDDFFANATELPHNLSDTDLTTFDSDVLGANGVVAFVPTYPLWSAGSGKLRHIRVPKGTSVKFDKAKQTFDIPPNTRFYKTFFRKVIDGAGHVSNRKMETRLIVARPDTVDVDGKTPLPTALYGTYEWSEDESTATLVDIPYRDGTPFADTTKEYVTDEIAYRDIISALGTGSTTTFPQRRRQALKAQPNVVQHYAIPGAQRCVQCHRGSPTQSFVLGFIPLQLQRRAAGTGGTYEGTGADELNQLQRMIDYGVISGMTSPSDVVLLENSQLPRKARTPQELNAQAYMVGNCAHCHNPRGYPSLVKPELASVLEFLPSAGADGGGIFEFPLERMSPVRSRGASGDVPMPYITPSLRDYPVADLEGIRMDNGAKLGSISEAAGGQPSEVTWTPKYSLDMEAIATRHDCGHANGPLEQVYCGQRKIGRSFVPAPWRSLLYRNVDAPFPYFDDYVPFPHMPMNSPGFDCRAPRIMGEWMVGLPAARKIPYVGEDVLPIPGYSKRGDGTYDDSPQPYVEVKPGDDGYAAAQAAAVDRLNEYRNGIRYQYCQDVLSPDILDPVGGPSGLVATQPVAERNIYLPDPNRYLAGGNPVDDPLHPGLYVQPAMGVPYHGHWFNYDPTEPAGDWRPRRSDVWKTVLIDGQVDMSPPAGSGNMGNLPDGEFDNRRRATEALGQATFSPALEKYATTELPYGLWQVKPECQSKLAGTKKVSDFTGVNRPAWMDTPDATGKTPSPDAPVFMMSPGGALYRHICFNCHGPHADGHGLQGDALAASSEGEARPANFMAGLFGPFDKPGANLTRVFGTPNDPSGLTYASRYMPWMALGGTLQLIPRDVIHQVEATKILGQGRPHVSDLPGNTTPSANMLNLAKSLCSLVLPDVSILGPRLIDTLTASDGRFANDADYPLLKSPTFSSFVTSNGDWEMWMNLCSRFNPPVVRVYGMYPVGNGAEGSPPRWDATLKALYYADGATSNDPATVGTKVAYPPDAPVLDHNKIVRIGVHPDNYYPACLQGPNDHIPGANNDPPPDAALAKFRQFLGMIPFCPPGFLDGGGVMSLQYHVDPDTEIDNVKEWTLRGAISAGMSVFAYLRTADLTHNTAVYYNQCQLLP